MMMKSILNFFSDKLGAWLAEWMQRSTRSTRKERKRSKLHENLHEFLCRHYELRYNVLSEQAEVCSKKAPAEWRAVDARTFNTLTMEAVDEGTGAWGVDMNRLLHSAWLPEFHPLRDYMRQLPPWDGEDRVAELSERVSQLPIWRKGFAVWLRALAAQWMGEERITANALVPLLVSGEQGMRKSSFARLLMPPELSPYFSDKFDLTAAAGCEQRLARLGLINLDEFDRYNRRQMSTLKNLLQLRQLTIRRQFTQQLVALPRMASFLGTSNELELLTDLTGSRRFLCIEVKKPIDCSPLAHAQLFAQLREEVLSGQPCHLNREEEAELQAHNRSFILPSPAAEVFGKMFAPAQDAEKGELMAASEIFQALQQHYPAAMRGLNASGFGRILRGLKVPMVRTARANCYRVVYKAKKT